MFHGCIGFAAGILHNGRAMSYSFHRSESTPLGREWRQTGIAQPAAA